MTRRILFVERDGALLPPSAASTDDFRRLVPAAQAIPALCRLSAAGYRIAVLDPPAEPACKPEDRRRDNGFLGDLLSSQGIISDPVLSCPHAAANECDCALPGLGLVRTYVADPSLDRRRSAVVGAGAPASRLAANMGLRYLELDATARLGWNDVAHELLDAPRRATVRRSTRETSIDVDVDLDARNDPAVSTGIGFFDHMLEQLGKHGGFALRIECVGDLQVDEHHTVEDVALALGEALRQALGPKLGIARYGFVLPMDEARVDVALDLSGRPYFVFEGAFSRDRVGGLPTELVPHFFRSLSDAVGATLHLSIRGENDHHLIEACFKGFARALRQAIRREGMDLPTTKGTL